MHRRGSSRPRKRPTRIHSCRCARTAHPQSAAISVGDDMGFNHVYPSVTRCLNRFNRFIYLTAPNASTRPRKGLTPSLGSSDGARRKTRLDQVCPRKPGFGQANRNTPSLWPEWRRGRERKKFVWPGYRGARRCSRPSGVHELSLPPAAGVTAGALIAVCGVVMRRSAPNARRGRQHPRPGGAGRSGLLPRSGNCSGEVKRGRASALRGF